MVKRKVTLLGALQKRFKPRWQRAKTRPRPARRVGHDHAL